MSLAHIVAVYSEHLALLSERLADTGAPVPAPPHTYALRECGHWWRRERGDLDECPACERFRRDMRSSLESGDSVRWMALSD